MIDNRSIASFVNFNITNSDRNNLFLPKDNGYYLILEGTYWQILEVKSFVNDLGDGGCIQYAYFTAPQNSMFARHTRIANNRVVGWSNWNHIMNSSDMAVRDNRMNNMDNDRNGIRSHSQNTYNRTTDLYGLYATTARLFRELYPQTTNAINVGTDAYQNRINDMTMTQYAEGGIVWDPVRYGRHSGYVLTKLNKTEYWRRDGGWSRSDGGGGSKELDYFRYHTGGFRTMHYHTPGSGWRMVVAE